MIVRMKKVTVIVRAPWKDEVLSVLGNFGVLHLRPVNPIESEKVEELKENTTVLRKALSLIPETFYKDEVPGSTLDKEGLPFARRLIESAAELKQLETEIKELDIECERIEVWGRFDPDDTKELKNKGLIIQLFQGHERELKKMAHPGFHIISRRGSTLFIAAVSEKGLLNTPLQEIKMPSRGLTEIETLLEEKKGKLLNIKKRFLQLSKKGNCINKTLARDRDILTYEEARAGMGKEGNISFLTGFCPEPEIKRLGEIATEKQWGIVIEDPSADDPVPTLVRYSKWTRLFRPVMDFLGVTPGYREFDTSGVFLIFFSIFFALLIGDGGYGVVLLLMTFLLKKSYKSIPKETISLFNLASMTTLLWGAVTGTWFGVEKISHLPLLENMVIPSLNSYTRENEGTIIHLCFLIGALQLSIAHVWTTLRVFPSLVAFAEIGWAIVVWGVYFIARFLVLNEEMSPFGFFLPIIGMSMVVLFGEQKAGSLLKGMGRGFIGLPMNFLTGIGNLSDLISYVRLFAVGLATKEVAVAFNSMAMDIGFDSVFSVVLSVFVLIFGHTINLLLAAMAVLVHGVRLNLLEFSKHLNIQWTGIPFKPFKTLET